MNFLTLIANMFETLNFTFFKCCKRNNNEGTKCCPKKIKIVKDVNDDETLVLNLAGEVLQVNERVKCFYNIMRDIVERTYRRTFHL